MIQTIVKIEGMACNMCESHMNDAIRNNFNVKKVVSSHTNCEAAITSEKKLDESKLKEVVEKTGYKFLGVEIEEVEKKGFFSKFKK